MGRASPEAVLGAVLLVALAAGCGGSSHGRARPSAPALVAATFSAHPSASSGRVALSLSLASGTREAFALRAAGPFELRSSASAPSFALAVTLSWRAPGRPPRTLPMTLVSTPRAVALSVRGRHVALAAGVAHALQAGYVQAQGAAGGDGAQGAAGGAGAPAPLGLHPAAWLSAPRLAGTAGSAPMAVVHISGSLALRPFLGELTRLVGLSTSLQELAGEAREATGPAAALTAVALEGHGSGHIELYSSLRDHLLRSLSASTTLTAPAGSREGAGRALTISFELSFSALGTAQRIPGR